MSSITSVAFFDAFPEFTPVGAGKFGVAKAVADSMASEWQGLETSVHDTATMLLIAHVLTIMVDGSSPIRSYTTKESKIDYENGWLNSKSAPADYSFQRTDYGVLLEDLLTIHYFGVS
jgi:hypothetical protein